MAPSLQGLVNLGGHYTPTGLVGDTKIVALHTDKDGVVVVENERAYADVVPAQNLTTAIVVEATPSHCGGPGLTETEAAWDALVDWVDGGPQPTASDIQTACEAMGGPGSCRIDPSFQVPELDSRIRPRPFGSDSNLVRRLQGR